MNTTTEATSTKSGEGQSSEIFKQDLKDILISFCNPLLDITATVDEAFLKKFNLNANDAILATPDHLTLYEELTAQYPVSYTAGGSSQNTMRAAQWVLPPNSTVYVGSIGSDAYGEQLRSAATGDGLRVEYVVDEDGAPTGTCACLITAGGRCRSLVANLGAASNFRLSHLKDEAIRGALEKAKYIYISGFFLNSTPETAKALLEYGRREEEEGGKIIGLNLSAPYICSSLGSTVLRDLLPHLHYVFGNESEARALATALQLGTEDIATIAKILSGPSTTVVITQGDQPTAVAHDGQLQWYEVKPIAAKDIVDTNGAGDAFVGGFLSQLVQGKSVECCVRAGQYVAEVIIKTSGIVFPPEKPTIQFD